LHEETVNESQRLANVSCCLLAYMLVYIALGYVVDFQQTI